MLLYENKDWKKYTNILSLSIEFIDDFYFNLSFYVFFSFFKCYFYDHWG